MPLAAWRRSQPQSPSSLGGAHYPGAKSPNLNRLIHAPRIRERRAVKFSQDPWVSANKLDVGEPWDPSMKMDRGEVGHIIGPWFCHCWEDQPCGGAAFAVTLPASLASGNPCPASCRTPAALTAPAECGSWP